MEKKQTNERINENDKYINKTTNIYFESRAKCFNSLMQLYQITKYIFKYIEINFMSDKTKLNHGN